MDINKIKILNASEKGLIAGQPKSIKNPNKDFINQISHMDSEQLKLLTNLAKQITKGESKKFTILADDYIGKDKRRFVKMYVKETAELIRTSKSLSDLKVLTTMIELMNFDTGEIFIPNTKIAKILEMKPQAVGRSIKSLIEQGYLLIKDGCEKDRIKTYLLNEKYFKYGR